MTTTHRVSAVVAGVLLSLAVVAVPLCLKWRQGRHGMGWHFRWEALADDDLARNSATKTSRRDGTSSRSRYGEDPERMREARELLESILSVAKLKSANGGSALQKISESLAVYEPGQYRLLLEGIMADAGLTPQERSGAAVLLLKAMASRFPQETLDFMERLRAEGVDAEVLSSVSRKVLPVAAAQEPDLAIDWITRNGTALSDPVEVKAGVLSAIASREPSRALALVDKLGVPPERAGRCLAAGATGVEMRTALLVLLREEAGKASNEGPTRNDEIASMRKGALEVMGEELARGGFHAQQGWLGLAGVSEEEERIMAGEVMPPLRVEESGPWLDWVVGHAGPDSLPGRIRELAGAWAMRDTSGAERWIAATEDPGVREAAVRVFVEKTAESDPAAAMRAVQLLPEGDLKEGMQRALREDTGKE